MIKRQRMGSVGMTQLGCTVVSFSRQNSTHAVILQVEGCEL